MRTRATTTLAAKPKPSEEVDMRKKILVVDDSATIHLMVRMVLGKDRYQLLTANDGREALEKARIEHPDLVVMDVVMPRMTGFEACRAMRADESTKEIPIILVTTRGEPESVQQGYESGCSDYVTKPINGLELLAKVQSCLGE
jgi:CheY-like chemotaxis protein